MKIETITKVRLEEDEAAVLRRISKQLEEICFKNNCIDCPLHTFCQEDDAFGAAIDNFLAFCGEEEG